MNPTLPNPAFLIEYDHICLAHGTKNIFSDFGFKIRKKEKVLVSGKSGSGKTTLFKLLLGFQEPEQGTIRYDGLPIDQTSVSNIRNQIFYLSQDVDFKNQNVSEALDEIFAANHKNISPKTLDDTLRFLEMDSKLLTQEIEDLSGGERQRLGLLVCFLINRPVWLLDEPTAALDESMKQKMADYILNCDNTVLIISHDSIWQADLRINIKRI